MEQNTPKKSLLPPQQDRLKYFKDASPRERLLALFLEHTLPVIIKFFAGPALYIAVYHFAPSFKWPF